MHEITNFDWFSWGVGFWEGEGSVGATHSVGEARRYLQLNAGQKDRGVLVRLQEAFGCGNVGRPNSVGCHYWAVSGEPAWNLMNRMVPYLSDRRKEQLYKKAGEVLASRNTVKHDYFAWMHYARVTLSDGRVLEWDPDIHFEWSE